MYCQLKFKEHLTDDLEDIDLPQPLTYGEGEEKTLIQELEVHHEIISIV